MNKSINVTALFCMLMFPACITYAQTGARLSPVSVRGNQFVKADGKTIIFRGLDASDPDKLSKDGHWNKEYFEMAKSWGANIIRFPVHPVPWRDRGKEEYIKLLDQGVQWATEAGLYV